MSVFLGWLPDAATQAALADLRLRVEAALPAGAPRHDWRRPAQWHMTLRYLGERIDEAQRARVESAMAGFAAAIAPADASITGAQYWPHARVLVAKIDASPALKALLKQLEADAQGSGFMKERAQTAHITLAYLPRGATPPALAGLDANTPLQVGRIDLLQTVPGGYDALASWPLAGRGDA
ncbi:2'-5' RNA ligase family protein [Thermomonas fusca]|uniref:2'-5' RNA ligase family protein n=1 Tax=Thermomonas fusca TaxID=215690 RepID=UPI0003FC55BB|nr:2'-5' RNA ligase family protein [Thermomonas fusca]